MKKDFIKEILQEKEIIFLIKQQKKQELKILINFIMLVIKAYIMARLLMILQKEKVIWNFIVNGTNDEFVNGVKKLVPIDIYFMYFISNSVPFPTSEVAFMYPLFCSIIVFAKDNPIPMLSSLQFFAL